MRCLYTWDSKEGIFQGGGRRDGWIRGCVNRSLVPYASSSTLPSHREGFSR